MICRYDEERPVHFPRLPAVVIWSLARCRWSRLNLPPHLIYGTHTVSLSRLLCSFSLCRFSVAPVVSSSVTTIFVTLTPHPTLQSSLCGLPQHDPSSTRQQRTERSTYGCCCSRCKYLMAITSISRFRRASLNRRATEPDIAKITVSEK